MPIFGRPTAFAARSNIPDKVCGCRIEPSVLAKARSVCCHAGPAATCSSNWRIRWERRAAIVPASSATTRRDLGVLGSLMKGVYLSSEITWRTANVPLSRSTSAHRSPRTSHRRIPVVASVRKAAYRRLALTEPRNFAASSAVHDWVWLRTCDLGARSAGTAAAHLAGHTSQSLLRRVRLRLGPQRVGARTNEASLGPPRTTHR